MQRSPAAMVGAVDHMGAAVSTVDAAVSSMGGTARRMYVIVR